MLEKLKKPVRIVLDTSTYVAALLSTTGGAAAVFEKVIAQEIFNFYTEQILTELQGYTRRILDSFQRLSLRI